MEENKLKELPKCSEYDFLYERNRKYMNEIALTFDKSEITYEELHTRIDEYARALYKRGVRENDLIAVSVANTPEAIYITYALNKLGAIICPINPLDNSYKVLQDLKVVKPKMFIGIQDSYSNFKKASRGMNIDIILFPAVKSIDSKLIKMFYGAKQFINGNTLLSLDKSLNHVIKVGKQYEDVVYPEYKSGVNEIMFTGGSSGTHKGVKLDGNGLNCVAQSLGYITDLKPGEIFMGNLPQFMAFGKLSLHYALCGNTNVYLTLKALPQFFKEELYRIKPQGVFAGPVQWEAFINDIYKEIDNNIKDINFVSNSKDDYLQYLNYLRDIIRNTDKNILNKLDLSFLKMGVSGGEQLKEFTELICNMIFEELNCQDEIWNGLGMTEMWAPVSVKRGKLNDKKTIGKIIPYNDVMVIDPITYDELPVNSVGLLCVTGPGMMLGYYNNEEESKKVFINKKGKKWIITGDIVKIDDEEQIHYIDRAKRSFVCGVENIYPQQIENLLSKIPEIEESIVTKIPDNKKQYLPKYHISLKNEQVDLENLKKKIELLIITTLGENSIPGYYEFYYEKLPRTANGKLDPKPLQEKDDNAFNGKVKVMSK